MSTPRYLLHLVISALLAFSGLCCEASAAASKPPAQLTYKVVRQLPHNVQNFTQGLVFYEGRLIESTGRYGQSAVYSIDPASGKSLQLAKLQSEFFGEGLAALRDRFFWVSWRERTGFVYDGDFQLLDTFNYTGEGWGLTALRAGGADRLVLSDGSSTLRLLDPSSFKEASRIEVRQGATPIQNINELEYAEGLIYANIWLSNFIIEIDPSSGDVKGYLDLSALVAGMRKPADWNAADHVLNGIAFDPASGHFYITGKCWPVIFEIEIERHPPVDR